MEGRLKERTRHSKIKILRNQLMLSPVYVKRGNPIHSNKIQETSTQAIREIFELEKQDEYMNTHCLKPSPRTPAEKDYIVQQVKEMCYKDPPYYVIPTKQKSRDQCIIANNGFLLDHKNMEDLNYNYTGYTIKNPVVYTAMPQKNDEDLLNVRYFGMVPINNNPHEKKISEIKVTPKRKLTGLFHGIPNKFFNGEMLNNQFEILHAHVFGMGTKKVLNSHTPIVVNIRNKKIAPKVKPKREIKEISVKSNSDPSTLSQVVGNRMTLEKRNKQSTFKSQSFVQPMQSKKILLNGIAQRTEAFKIGSSEIKRMLKFHKSGDADIGFCCPY